MTQCSMCNKPIIPNSKDFAINKDGTPFCVECFDIHDWMTPSKISAGEKIAVKTPVEAPVKAPVKASSLPSIRCPKCRTDFTEKTCKCGFKNPLFR